MLNVPHSAVYLKTKNLISHIPNLIRVGIAYDLWCSQYMCDTLWDNIISLAIDIYGIIF